MDQLRQADNLRKADLLIALQRTPCRQEDLCEYRRVCIDAYSRHVRGLSEVAAARQSLSEDEPERAEGRLRTAEKDLTEALALAEQCTTAGAEVVRAYKL